MELRIFHVGPIDNCVYLISDDSEAVVIDPAYGSMELILKEVRAKNLSVKMIINTHGHWDHIADNQPLHKATQARIACHKNEEEFLLKPNSQGFDISFEINSSRPEQLLWEGSTIVIGSLRFRVIHVPGHRPGSICLYEESEKILFTGDTLFKGTYGRTDFIGGSEKDLFASLKRLAKLPSDVIVYPGHGKPTTIGEEKKWIDLL